MALKRWHYGKLILLWTWGVLLSTLALYVALGLEPGGQDTALPVVGLIAIAVAFLIPACLSVVTWIWLGGKEGTAPNTTPPPEVDSPSR